MRLTGQTRQPRRPAVPARHPFNGGPGNCPAKRRTSPARTPRRSSGFNGGPGNCPAKRAEIVGQADGEVPASMEGRAIARPNVAAEVDRPDEPVASMEGRAIARPNRHSPTRPNRGHPASMEGRAIARPNPHSLASRLSRQLASMEGRAIARPNRMRPRTTRANNQASMDRAIARPPDGWPPLRTAGFNGGPGNCPAKRDRAGIGPAAPGRGPCFNGGPGNCPAKRDGPGSDLLHYVPASLQWRAGQLPGQTGSRRRRTCGLRDARASMEGRAIARPNGPRRATQARLPSSGFNGGPGNCPAKPSPGASR